MKKALALLLLAAGCSAAPRLEPAAVAKVDAAAAELLAKKELAGLVVLAARDGELVLERAYGLAEIDGA